MSFVKYMLIIILLSSLQIMSKAQSGIQGCYGFDCRQKKWSASFFTGYNLVGPGQSLKDRIMKTAFGDTQTGYATAAGPADPVKYPKHTESSPWNIELRYKVSKRISFGLDAGQLSKNKIEAYAHLFTIPNEVDGEYEVGNYLTLKSDLKAVSLLYIRKLNFVDDEISIGPALALSGIHDADTKGTVNNPTVIKPGIQVGYAIEFVKTKSFFLKAQLKYTWFPDAHIGTIVKEYDSEKYGYDPDNHTSVFKAINVSLSTIRIGLSAGVRF